MSDDSGIRRWLENAERGMVENKPSFVITSSNRLKAMNRRDVAEQILKDAIQIFEQNPQIFRELASTIIDRNAEEGLEFTIQYEPILGNHARFQHAVALSKLRRNLEAINIIEGIIKDDYQFTEDRFVATKLVSLYNDESQLEKAAAFLEPLIDKGVFPDIRMRQHLATVLNKLRRNPQKVLDLLRNDVDPRSTALKREAADILAPYIQHPAQPVKDGSIFIVHGRNHEVRDKIDLYLSKELKLRTEIMEAGSHQGRTLSEKFEEMAERVSFAIFILSADDLLTDAVTKRSIRRARQNVILEVGYFWGLLGRRGRVAFLVDTHPEMELPTDIQGLGWIPITDDLAQTKLQLSRELMAARIVA